MLSKNAIKYINSLKIKKYRLEHQAFLVEGEKCVSELLVSSLTTKAVYCTESWHHRYSKMLGNGKFVVELVTENELTKISDLTTPNQVLAVAAMPEPPEPEMKIFSDIILALDSIRDPGNMGTILRTADWFGITHVVCSPDCVDIYNTKVVQASMGSIGRIKVHSMPLAELLSMRPKGTPIYGALLQGETITSKKFLKNGILIIGNESQGISQQLLPLITDPVFIPPFLHSENSAYHAESLNASVANAIICYEIRKQLGENKF